MESDADYVKARALYDQDSFRKAVVNFTGCLIRYPSFARALAYRGDCKRMMEDQKGALADLDAADQLAPDNAFTLKARGVTKKELGDLKGSLIDLDAADRLWANDWWTLCERAGTKTLMNDLKGALDDLDAADRLKPDNFNMLCTRGSVKRKLGDLKGALADLENAYKLNPEGPSILEEIQLTKEALAKVSSFSRSFPFSLFPSFSSFFLSSLSWFLFFFPRFSLGFSLQHVPFVFFS